MMIGWRLPAESLAFPAWSPSDSHLWRGGSEGKHPCSLEVWEANDSRHTHRGVDSKSLRERESLSVSECVRLFLLLWQAPDWSCHLHFSHKGLMGRQTWQEGGTPICLMSDFAEWLCKHLSITVRAGRELQYSWNVCACMFSIEKLKKRMRAMLKIWSKHVTW